jgi:hypothetical protein
LGSESNGVRDESREAGKEAVARSTEKMELLSAEDVALVMGVNETTVWASFDWVMEVDLETALEQQERLTEIVDASQLVVKTAALEEAVDRWSSAELRRAQSSHSATILASECGLSMSRATPMPPS